MSARASTLRTVSEVNAPASIKPLLVAEQVETILQVSKQRIYEMARLGIFTPGVVVRMGRQVRFDEDALRAWIRSGGTAAE
jgi:predicted DNA-binding transcriptional regulator AlpA